MMLSSHLSPDASTNRNGTAMASTCLVPHCRDTGSWADSLREVSGAVLVSGLIQLVLGVSGVCGWAARHCGPMVLAPSLSIIGLSAYKEAAFFCSTNWGVALLLMLLAVTFSQHLRSCRLPFCAWPHAWEGSTESSVPTLRTFSVLLPFAGVCIVCAILSYFHIPWESLDPAMAQLSWANSTFNAPWIHIPYAGEWRWPLLTPRVLAVGIAMAVGCSMNSVGCYVLCGRLLRVPRLPPHACNRGLCMEGLGSLLAGLLGTLGGTASSIANTCATGLTQELNKRLTVHVSSFLNHLCNLMCPLLAGQPDATTAFSCHRSASGLRLHVKSELSGLPFYWDFHCCPAPLEMVFRHLVRPLIQMNLVLQCQVQELVSLLLQKDAEIEDYRENGATLSRDRLRTEPFQEETFQQNLLAKTLPRICAADEGREFASALQQLYTAVTQQEAKQAQKRRCSEDDVDTAPTAETTEHPHPPPPSQEDETTSSSKRTSPASSPAQKPRLPAAKAKPKKAKGLFS